MAEMIGEAMKIQDMNRKFCATHCPAWNKHKEYCMASLRTDYCIHFKPKEALKKWQMETGKK